MSSNIVVLGPESSVIYYNLNKQFATVRKIIVTSEIILSAFETADISMALSTISSIEDPTLYNQKVNEVMNTGVFDSTITSELSKQIQEKFPAISENMMNIQLENFNFMNTMSNTKFTLTLRTESFSLSKYYVEKATLNSTIRHLLKEYIQYEGNSFRLSKLSNFQIEIYESEEIYKHVLLKKDGDSLVLNSNFGFDLANPTDYNVSGEIYFSKGESFQLFPNNQNNAVIKDHSHLIESEIHKQAKILSDENLLLINDNTKNIHDAIIEVYLTRKGNLRILNLSLLENSLDGGNENGFVINKSSKNYNKISITGLRDNLDEELANPKYLLIRNNNEIKEIMSSPQVLRNVDGIIFNETFYSPFLDKIGQSLDIDIIYYKNQLTKSLEVKVDISNLDIESGHGAKPASSNPFSSILDESRKEKDEHLERLRNIDLSTPRRTPSQENNISNIAEQLISSPNSSVNKSGRGSSTPMFTGSTAGMSAMEMLAQAALAPPTPKPQPEPTQHVVEQSKAFTGSTTGMSAMEMLAQAALAPPTPKPQPSVVEQPRAFAQSELVMNNITATDLNPIYEDNISNTFSGFEQTVTPQAPVSVETIMPSSINASKYEKVLATKIMTNPGINSQCYFADSSNLAEVNSGDIFLMTTSVENLGNPHLNYVLPIDLFEDGIEDNYFILSSTDDFVSLNRHDLKCFVNISSLDPRIKRSFLEKCSSYLSNPICVIMMKEDLELIKDLIHKIDIIYVQDISYDEDLEELKQIVLGFEKSYLIRN